MIDKTLSEAGVLKLLSNIKVNESPGPDNIPLVILKEAGVELCPVLTFLF